jgi:DNA-binding transcriptional MerR regulator
MSSQKTFTTREICRKLDISERKLIMWAEKRLIQPLQDASGYSTRRVYSVQNVIEIAVIDSLWGKISNETITTIIGRLSLERDGESDYWVFFGDNSFMPVRHNEFDGTVESHPDRNKLFFNILYRNEIVTIVNLRLIKEKVHKIFDIG